MGHIYKISNMIDDRIYIGSSVHKNAKELLTSIDNYIPPPSC